MSTEIIMPLIGEGVVEATVIDWLKTQGDHVERDEPILEVETDKVTFEIQAEDAGTLLQQHVNAGDTVEVGAVLGVIGAEDDVPEPVTQTAGEVEQVQPRQPTPPIENVPDDAPRTAGREFDGVRVSPVVARMVQVHDLDVHEIEGTGRDGRITKRDVEAYMESLEAQSTHATQAPEPRQPATNGDHKRAEPAAPPVEQAAEDELVPLTGIRRAIADHMVTSKRTSPHATTLFEFDFGKVAEHRRAHKAAFADEGIKLTYMPYIAQATAAALKAHPMVNASWTDDGILLRKAVNLGVAVAAPRGLLVPVIENADRLNLRGLALAINDVADRAGRNQIKPDELRGGTFTVSNHGVSGSLAGTPIINQPQVGILGVGMIEERVKAKNGAIFVRPCAYISFSFDHRVLDGATADAFVMDIKHAIEDFKD